MGLIREPLTVDIVFADKELTAEDGKRISEYIRKQKALRKKKFGARSKHSRRKMVAS